MSNTAGRVYLVNGDVLGYVEIAGTCDPPVCMPRIWQTPEELEQNWRKQEWKSCGCSPDTEVVITEYIDPAWSQHWWSGMACSEHRLVLAGHSPSENHDERHHKLPFHAPEEN